MKILITILMLLQSTPAAAQKLYPLGTAIIIGVTADGVEALTECQIMRVKDAAGFEAHFKNTPGMKHLETFEGDVIWIATGEFTKTGSIFVAVFGQHVKADQCEDFKRAAIELTEYKFKTIQLLRKQK